MRTTNIQKALLCAILSLTCIISNAQIKIPLSKKKESGTLTPLSINDKVKITDTITSSVISGTAISSTGVATAAVSSSTASCPKIQGIVSLNAEKKDDGSYEISFVDKDGNPVVSFTMSQYNEALFYDKIETSLANLCGGFDLNEAGKKEVKDKIEQYKKQNLFTLFLQAGLQTYNEKVKAGTLKISKYPIVHEYLKKPSKSTNRDNTSFLFNKSQDILSENTSPFLGLSGPSLEIDKYSGSYTETKIDNTPQAGSFIPDGNLQINSTPTVNEASGMPLGKKFTVQSISIQFQDGFIEVISVLGKIEGDDHLLRFENVYPISFSTRREFELLYRINLFEKTVFKGAKYCLNLGELIMFNYNLDLNTKDYSPENIVITPSLTDDITDVPLYKEQISKILELKVYSDLMGTGGTNPNGLVQLEVNKRLNLWSNRVSVIPSQPVNFGFFNFITPEFSLSKIEDNQKRLILGRTDTIASANDTTRPVTYGSTINLMQHQIFKIGGNLNVFLVDIPAFKSTVYFNMGLYFGHNEMQDTIRTHTTVGPHPLFTASSTNNVIQYGVNTFQLAPEINMQIFPHPKWGVTASQRFTNFKVLTDQFTQVRDSADFVKFVKQNPVTRENGYSFSRWIATTEFSAFILTAENSKVFARYRINWDLANSKNTFYQLQVGFVTAITVTKSKADNKTTKVK